MHALLLEIAERQAPDARAIAQAVVALPAAVGEGLAKHCEILGLRQGVLLVRCSHPAVRSELCARQGWAEALDIAGVTGVEFL